MRRVCNSTGQQHKGGRTVRRLQWADSSRLDAALHSVRRGCCVSSTDRLCHSWIRHLTGVNRQPQEQRKED